MTKRPPVPQPSPADRMTGCLHADVLVVGAGPAGLYAAYYAGFRGLSAVVMDCLPEIGGQVTAMYPERLIYDVAGFPAVRGRELITGLAAQAGRYAPVYLLGEEARQLSRPGAGLAVTTSSGRAVQAGFIVLTGGIGSFAPRPLPALARFEGRGLSYLVPDPGAYRGQDVIIVGSGDSAYDWAITLAPLASSVLLVHRRAALRPAGALARQVSELPVPVLATAEIVAGHGDGWLEAVEILDRRTGQVRRHPAQRVVGALGFTTGTGAVAEWGLPLAGRRIRVDTTMATGLDRVYAAGDIADYPGKLRLISAGFGEAVTAVNNAVAALHPHARLFPGHSSDARSHSPDAA